MDFLAQIAVTALTVITFLVFCIVGWIHDTRVIKKLMEDEEKDK